MSLPPLQPQPQPPQPPPQSYPYARSAAPSSTFHHNVSEVFDACPSTRKKHKLAAILEAALNSSASPNSKVVIFVNGKDAGNTLSRDLYHSHWPALFFDSEERTESQRKWTLDEYMTGKATIMVITNQAVLAATEPAATFTADNDLKCIINYDFPTTVESYLFRAKFCHEGGIVYSFFDTIMTSNTGRASHIVESIVAKSQGFSLVLPLFPTTIAPQPGVLQLQSSESSALPFAPKSEQHILPMNSVQRFFAANKIITNANEHSTFPPTIEASPTRDPAAHAAKEDISEVVKDKKVSQSPSLSVASGDDGSESSSTFDPITAQPLVLAVVNKGQMEYRQLGNSGLKVSAISLGTFTNFHKKLSDDSAFELIAYALQNGINTFDISESYGNGLAQQRLGTALKRGGWKRSDFVITCRLNSNGYGPNDKGLSRKRVFDGIANSLQNLQLDYIDVILLHEYDEQTPIGETISAIGNAIQNGKALYWGTVNWTASQLAKAITLAEKNHISLPIVEQPVYNMFARTSVEGPSNVFAVHDQIGIMAAAPLLHGILSGKYVSSTNPPAAQFKQHQHIEDSDNKSNARGRHRRSGAKQPKHSKSAASHLEATMSTKFVKMRPRNARLSVRNAPIADIQSRRCKQLLENLQCSLTQLALAWCLRLTKVCSIIVGANSVAQLQENIGAISVYNQYFAPANSVDGEEKARAEKFIQQLEAFLPSEQ